MFAYGESGAVAGGVLLAGLTAATKILTGWWAAGPRHPERRR